MSCFSAGLFLGGQRLGGVIVLGCLILPTSLEGFYDFCLGCWMFGWGIRLGLIRPSIYRFYLVMMEDRKWTYDFMHNTENIPRTENAHYLLPGQIVETPIDLIRKNRLETEYVLISSVLSNILYTIVLIDYFILIHENILILDTNSRMSISFEIQQ